MTTAIPFEDRVYDLFNRERTIGVRATHGGAIIAVHLKDDVRKMSERDLAREILKVAELASARGRLSLREKIEEVAAEEHRAITDAAFEVLPECPTRQEYDALQRAAMG